jgi:hypothetical protein
VTQNNVEAQARPSRTAVSRAVVGTARSLRLDGVAGELFTTLDKAGIDAMLLKGAAHARWLYEDGTPRPYCDIDVLVRPDQHDAAAAVLRNLGFLDVERGFRRQERCSHAAPYVRPPGIDRVDLHRCIPGVTVDADRSWSVLRTSATTAMVGGAQVKTLAPAARTMHVALHAAQHGASDDRPRAELARAVRIVDIDTWRGARGLAAQLGAAEAMATGLRLVDGGDLLATQLGLPVVVSRRVAARAWSTTRGTGSLVQFLDAPTLRTKLHLVGSKVAPSPTLMRSKSRLAGRGPAGLGAAYVLRMVFMVGQIPALWRDYRLVASRASGDVDPSTQERAGSRSSSA